MKSFTSILIFLFFNYVHLNAQSGEKLAQDMIKSTRAIESMSFLMVKKERINGELITQSSEIKLIKNPLQVYTKQKTPKDGLEVIYDTRKSKTSALINPNGFPWVNLTLDPLGDIMRKNQHHTIMDSGFELVLSIIEHLMDKYHEEIDEMIQIKGSKVYKSVDCWVLEFNNSHFENINYTVKENENLLTIAQKFKISEYKILELNPSVKEYTNVSVGQNIKIINDYASKMVLIIDKKTLVPLSIEVFDDLGLYEHYTYSNLKLNPDFAPNEFSPDFDDYNF